MLIDNISRLNRSSQNSIFAAIFVIAAIAMYQWIFNPHVDYLYASQRYDSTLNKYLERNKAINLEIKTKTEKIQTLSKQLSEAMNLVFTPEEARVFFGNLQNTLANTGCTVHTMNLIGEKSKKGKKLPDDASEIMPNNATLSISGPYKSIIALIDKLQKHNPKIWIDSFQIEITDQNSGWLKCDMTITIFTVQDKEAGL
jgi:hypothetical protein